MPIALIFWHLALPSALIHCLFKLWIWDKKAAQTRGCVLYIGLYRDNINKHYYLKPQDIDIGI